MEICEREVHILFVCYILCVIPAAITIWEVLSKNMALVFKEKQYEVNECGILIGFRIIMVPTGFYKWFLFLLLGGIY